jgi:surface-anchored protein
MNKLITMTSDGRDTRLACPGKGKRTGGPPVPSWGRNLLRTSILLFCTALSVVHAHEHVEVGRISPLSNQLTLSGPSQQLALYVPLKEFFSGYLPQFPGGWHACELTFTTEVNALYEAAGANPRIEVVSVSGPAGGNFAFWEVGATSPTWSLPAGWTGTGATFPVVVNGETHAHGRAFTMDKPGTYTVTFQAVDIANKFTASANKTITFVAQQPPQLSIALVDGDVSLSFTSRANLVYDLQVCTDLASGEWTNVEQHTFMDGDGEVKSMSDLVEDRPKALYRLVEY